MRRCRRRLTGPTDFLIHRNGSKPDYASKPTPELGRAPAWPCGRHGLTQRWADLSG